MHAKNEFRRKMNDIFFSSLWFSFCFQKIELGIDVNRRQIIHIKLQNILFSGKYESYSGETDTPERFSYLANRGQLLQTGNCLPSSTSQIFEKNNNKKTKKKKQKQR